MHPASRYLSVRLSFRGRSHSTHRAPEEDPSLQPSSEEQATVATVAKSTELEGPPEHAAQRQGCGLCRRRRAAVAPE